MPIEIREIVFSSAELTSAISEFYHRERLNGDHDILKVTATDDFSAPVTISVYTKKTDQRGVESLSRAEVGAALIAYCRHNAVMMPRRSRKSVNIKNGQITLKLRFVSGKSADTSSYSSLGT